MSAIQLINTTPSEFAQVLEESLVKKIVEKISAEFQPKQPAEYLTRAEVCEVLKIDLSTLWRWTKNSTLKAYGIGNRVYYKRSEIEAYLESNRLN